VVREIRGSVVADILEGKEEEDPITSIIETSDSIQKDLLRTSKVTAAFKKLNHKVALNHVEDIISYYNNSITRCKPPIR